MLEAQARRQIRRHRLHFHAELRATDPAVLAQIVHDAARHVRRNREADADVRIDGREHLGVDPDHFALRVHQGAARVAVVDRRIGLQEVLVAAVAVAIARAGRPALGAHDPHRHRLADAKGVAYRQHDVANLRVVGVAKRRGLQTRGVHLHEREIARLVGADDLRFERAAIREIDVNRLRAFDDVVVRQDVAIARHDHTGPEAALTEAPG